MQSLQAHCSWAVADFQQGPARNETLREFGRIFMATFTETARMIFDRALAECSVEPAVTRRFFTRDAILYIDGEEMPLSSIARIRIVAAGKAAGAMAMAAWQPLRDVPRCDVAGIVISPELPAGLPDRFQYFCGGHPTPNQDSFAGARAALDLVRAATGADTLCLFLVSGGASAMMELPLDPAIPLADTAEFYRTLVASGATIAEINCVRKHFSAVKGGRLALAAGGAMCRSLLISDVPRGQEAALGSGPTLPDPSTAAECLDIIEAYSLLPQFTPPVQRFFASPALAETPKPTEVRGRACVLLDAEDLARAAAKNAEALGWTAVIDNGCDEWDYQQAAIYLLDRLRALRGLHGRVCLVSAGEVIVRLPARAVSGARSGTGGRNQQFVLYAATLLKPGDGAIAILSAGSDGIDGNSPAAGGVIDESTIADPAGLQAAYEALHAFDAHPFLRARNATITTGPSGNNLRDLRILLAACPRETRSP